MKKILDILKLEKNFIFYALGLFLMLLPFQFALSPTRDIDLAIVRVIILIGFGFFVFCCFDKKIFFKKNDTITHLFYAFFILVFISLFYSQNILWSLRKISFLLSIFPLYFIALKIFENADQRKKTFLFFIYGSIALATLSLIQFFAQFIFGIDNVYNFLAQYIAPFFLGQAFSHTILSFPSWLVASNGNTYMRAIGTFPDPHMLSYYMGLSIPFSVAAGNLYKNKKIWFYGFTFIILIADIATFTRGGYIALIAAMLVIVPLVKRKNIIKIAASVALILLFLNLVPNNPVGGRFESSFDTNEGSNHARLSNWEQAFEIIKNNPQGVGIGMYPLYVDKNANYRTPIYAHNLYLDIAAELGIISLIVFVIVLAKTFIIFWQKAKRNNFYLAGVFSITLFSIHSIVETPLYSVHILPIFFIITALASSISRDEKSNT